jgi:hypothetical protein
MARLVQGALEVAQPLPEDAAGIGEAVRPEHQQRDREEEEEFAAAHAATG